MTHMVRIRQTLCGAGAVGPLVAVALLSGSCGDGPTSADPNPPRILVTGSVYGDGQPLENVAVVVGWSRRAVMTDVSGRYQEELQGVAPEGLWVTAHDALTMGQHLAAHG